MKEIISHIKQLKNGTWVKQENAEHLLGVAKLAQKFADEFGMGECGYLMGILHDIGKEQSGFQDYIQHMSGYDESKSAVKTPHAFVGGSIISKILNASNLGNILMSGPIIGHHKGLTDYAKLLDDRALDIPEGIDVDNDIKQRLLTLEKSLTNPGSKSYEVLEKSFANNTQFHHLIRLLYSCLVDADYLNTEEFMCPNSFNLRKKNKTLLELYPLLESYINKFGEPTTGINKIRRDIQNICINKSTGDTGFYSLTVPTGGAKTLSSLLWAMKHAIAHNMNRVIIAIPYTSIITQTANILKSIFGEDNVLEHHSNVDPEKILDSRIRLKRSLASENWDCPIIVTTNVQLFESMFSNKPSKVRKLHNIVNSVIIFDEVQTLSPNFLMPIIDGLKAYVNIFNCSILFTTASQPVLSGNIKGKNGILNGINAVTEIIPNDWALHEKLRRVNIINLPNADTYVSITDKILTHDCALCIVNTRKDAAMIYEQISKKSQDAIVLHLSRMMCSEHINNTIDNIKALLKNKNDKKLYVITTQLIEAGVDIDFPVVYRQEVGLDSVLQAAGRCNREGKNELNVSNTFVFSLADEVDPNGRKRILYGDMKFANNARLSVINMDPFDPRTMAKYFVNYYRTQDFDVNNIQQNVSEINFSSGEPKINFSTVAEEFRLIDDSNISVVVNYGDAADIIKNIDKYDDNPYKLIKKLNKYIVNISIKDYNTLIGVGAIQEVAGVNWVYDTKYYDKMIGLNPNYTIDDEIYII